MTSEHFLTFEKFSDPELANTIAAQLKAQGITSSIVNEGPAFDPTFANNNFEPNIHLKLNPDDFSKARRMLEKYYQGQLADIDPDYYLFSFSDTELLDLIKNPDEWGPLDYALAKHILAEHGIVITPDQEAIFQKDRIRKLRSPEKTPRRWIILGYIAAVVFPILGLILGYILAHAKKTLPNGTQVLVYSAAERKNGNRILFISTIFFLFWVCSFLVFR